MPDDGPQFDTVGTPPPLAPPVQGQDWSQAPAAPVADPMGGLIPTKNPKALVSYYLGLFSIFPLLGLPLACVAIWFGKQGVEFGKAHPEVKGVTHAKVGFGCGLCGLLINLFIIVAFVMAILTAGK